ncbi:hypothetical protein [Acidocella aminolytica]|nr:hypothetical protein [Acidocella aminolytica]
MSQAQVAQATATAWRMTQTVMTSNATDNLKLLQDLKNTLGSMNEAVSVSNPMGRVVAVLGNLTGKPSEGEGYALAKFLDQSGRLVDPQTGEISPANMLKWARIAEGIAAATNARVDPRQMLNFQVGAKAAGSQLSEQGFLDFVPTLLANGGSKAGTWLGSLEAQMLGGIQFYSQSVRSFEGIGLLDPRKVHKGGGGRFAIGDGAWQQSDLLRHDPAKWVWDVLIPDLKKHGYKTIDQQVKFLQHTGLRQTVSGLLVELLRNETADKRDIKNVGTATSVDQYKIMQNTSPTAQLDAFNQAWNNLLTALGSPMVGTAYHMLDRVTAEINKLGAWAAAHPKDILAIEKMVAAIAGITVVMGSAAVVGAAVTALGALAAPTGLLALAAGIAALGDAFPKIPKWLIHMAEGAAVGGAAGATGGAFVGGVGAAPGAVVGSMVGAGVAGADEVGKWLAHVIIGAQTEQKAAPPAHWITKREKNGDLIFSAPPQPTAPPTISPTAPGVGFRPQYVPPAKDNSTTQVHTVIKLDGRVLARHVSEHQARAANRPPASGTAFDPSAAPLYPSSGS